MSDLADVIHRAVKDLRELRNRNDVADDLEAALSLPPEPPTRPDRKLTPPPGSFRAVTVTDILAEGKEPTT